jgi:hypothetical protein
VLLFLLALSAKHGRNFLCYCFAETAESRLLGLPKVVHFKDRVRQPGVRPWNFHNAGEDRSKAFQKSVWVEGGEDLMCLFTSLK